MSNIETSRLRTPFFPNTREKGLKRMERLNSPFLKRNSLDKKGEIDSLTKNDVKIDIKDAIKDFARIKKAVDASETIDKSDKIKSLKEQIKNGTYNMNYDKLGDKILSSEY